MSTGHIGHDHAEANPRPARLQQAAIRAGWLVLVALLLAVFAAGVPVRLGQLMTVAGADSPALVAGLPPVLFAAYTGQLGPPEAAALQAMGLSRQFYAGYLLAFDLALALAGTVVGLFIFWRRSDEWLTWWVALFLVLLGTNGISAVVPTLATVWPSALWVLTGVGLLGMISFVYILFLSPDGRAVPRWTLFMAAGFTGGLFGLAAYTWVLARQWGVLTNLVILAAAFPVWLTMIGLGLFSQVYRYQRVSGPVQRQQTKWVVIGLAAVGLGLALNVAFLFVASQQTGQGRLLATLARAPLVYGCMLLLPICLAFSVLRYRLWDIDILIRRTLVYAVLTGLLALVYFGAVLGLQSLFAILTGQRQSTLVTVLSTLVIAALFVPLRRWVQAVIDRRLYRRKYDAAKTLAAFGASVRDEVDLDRLSEHLTQAVREAMAPESVNLWFRK